MISDLLTSLGPETASLRFQPTKRPQQNPAAVSAKAKAKAVASKISGLPVDTEPKPELKPEPVPKSTLADWTATASDDEWNTFEGKRQRGARKKRKKNQEAVELTQNWDDIYDPSRPNNYEEYKHSEEKLREVREWKDLLYRHRTRSTRSDSEENGTTINSNATQWISQDILIVAGFAPPMSFAPPSNLNDDVPPPDVLDDADGENADARMGLSQAPSAIVPDDPTGEDAYARRINMSQHSPLVDIAQPPAPPPGQITRAPVRYNLPPAPESITSEAELENIADEDQPRSNRPGQADFAERLLSKYGWSKGQGLGAQGTGIINPLYAKADRRKKKSDAQGGGYATPASTGKILGGTKPKAADEGKFGAMSEVIRLENMLDGMDLDEEIGREEGGIMQEIGEECGEKYGSVERVYIHPQDSPLVFVQFVSQLSALRAVNALEGRVFGGNTLTARFWSKEKFESAEYTRY